MSIAYSKMNRKRREIFLAREISRKFDRQTAVFHKQTAENAGRH
jgi:hypothetical protein